MYQGSTPMFDFADKFKQLTNDPPFPWQTALFESMTSGQEVDELSSVPEVRLRAGSVSDGPILFIPRSPEVPLQPSANQIIFLIRSCS
jgi:hypothetical protein